MIKESYQFQSQIGDKSQDTKREGNFSTPRGVAIHPTIGNIFVSDTWNHRIQVFQSDGSFLRAFGKKGAAYGEFQYPSGLEFDVDGNLLIVDTDNARVQFFDSEDKFIGQIHKKGDDTTLKEPYAMAVDHHGQFLVTDMSKCVISVFARDRTFMKDIGGKGAGPGQLESPSGIAVDIEGNIIVCEVKNHRIQYFSPNGDSLRILGRNGKGPDEFLSPWGITTDGAGNVIVTDQAHEDNNRIKILSKDGELLQIFPKPGEQTLHRLNSPKTSVLTKDGALVITDVSADRIVIFG